MPVAPSVPVVVILGAGASFASGDFPIGTAPPLTADLFDNERARVFIHEYPLAQMAGRAIERAKDSETPLPLEEALLSLRTSSNAHRRLMAQTVPLFLQDLLLRASGALYHEVFRYDALIDLLSDLPQVHYVTLNYDVLLDSRLHQFRALRTFDDYVGPSNQWNLFKLHGSVNWSYKTTASFNPFQPPMELAIDRSAMVCAEPTVFDLASLRDVGQDGWVRQYPAIALPEGPKDQLVIPESHKEYLVHSLTSARLVDVIVAGYSALDTEVLGLLRDCEETQIRRLTVVNRDAAAALAVWDEIAQQKLDIVWPDVYAGSFSEWIDRGGLKRWIDEYGGPYRTVTAPDEVRNRLWIQEREREMQTLQQKHDRAGLPPLPDRW